MSWNTSANAATYAVQVSTDAAFGSTVTAQIGLTGTTASISGLGNSATYYWRVGAKDAGGVSGWSGGWSFTTIVAAPSAPSLASPSNGAGNQPISSLGLSWGSSALATSYEVEVSLSSGFGSTLFDQSGVLTNATVNGLDEQHDLLLARECVECGRHELVECVELHDDRCGSGVHLLLPRLRTAPATSRYRSA